MQLPQGRTVRAIIGLGNPGAKFVRTRHNIGFLVVDELAERHAGVWREQGEHEVATISIGDKQIMLIKPQTFMNSSGKAVALLAKKGIPLTEVLVVHDELEAAFGKVSLKVGGSAKGHNGLRSLIALGTDDFLRLRCGIGRPERKEDVGTYVLQSFSEPWSEVQDMIQSAASGAERLC